MREFIEFIAKHLVDHPEAVRLEQEERDTKIVLKLKVGDEEQLSALNGVIHFQVER